MVFSAIQVNIALENDPLIIHDRASAATTGCVLRGILNIHLKQPTRIKSVILVFSGTLRANWPQCKPPLSNWSQITEFDHMDRTQYDRSLIQHKWVLLPPPYTASSHSLPAGNHAYDFELPLTGDLPLSSKIETVYMVQYQLEATIQRPSFLPNIECQRKVYLTRALKSASDGPVTVESQWRQKLAYHISIPSKVYHHGDIIPATIHLTPLMRGLIISHIDSTLIESSSCGPMDGLFNGQSRDYLETIYYLHTKRPAAASKKSQTTDGDNDGDLAPWRLTLSIPIHKTEDDLQYDTEKNEGVYVHHKVKFDFHVETKQRQSRSRHTESVSIPILILPKSNTERPPTYHQRNHDQSYPYDPDLMGKLLRQHNQ